MIAVAQHGRIVRQDGDGYDAIQAAAAILLKAIADACGDLSSPEADPMKEEFVEALNWEMGDVLYHFIPEHRR